MRTRQTVLWLVAGALSTGVFGALVMQASWPHVPVDDAYITFRYAENLVQGHGLVFNQGERVEGYTSLSWTLLIAGLRVLGLAPLQSATVLGFPLFAATIAVIASFPVAAVTRLWACLAISTALPMVYHYVNGLETGLMTLLVTLLVRQAPSSRATRMGTHAVIVALVLTRPEGLLCVGFWILGLAVSQRAWKREFLAFGAVAAATALVHLGLRFAYYGDWIANSARAKLLPIGYALGLGVPDLARFGWDGVGGLLIAAAACAAWRALRAQDVAADILAMRRLTVVLAGLLPVLACSGGDAGLFWRFYVPVLPALCLLGAQGLDWELAGASRGSRARLVLGHALALALAFGPRALAHPALARQIVTGSERHWTRIGIALAQQAPRDARIAVSPAGAIPYFSGLFAIDMLGLTEPFIARVAPDMSYDYPGHQRHSGRHVLDRAPDLIVLANGPAVSQPSRHFPFERVLRWERDLVADPRFEARYKLVHLPLDGGDYLQLFARKDFLTQ